MMTTLRQNFRLVVRAIAIRLTEPGIAFVSQAIFYGAADAGGAK